MSAVTLTAPTVDGGVHFLPNDGRRFPFCGSWRSNWSQTSNPDRVTCPQCRACLTVARKLPAPEGPAGSK